MSVEDFFKGKHIFITGGSGFIGKVLIEKLLRSCGGIEKIYLLLRNKRNKAPEERLKDILESEIFSKLKISNPDAFKKIIPIRGDTIELKLGLSDEDTQCLIDNVDIIYHAAASVRFDDHLKDSILLNTRGTREVVNLALQAKKLVTFIHVSTTYCQSDKKYVEEKMYPAHTDWKNAIKLAEEVDQHTLNILSMKFIHPLPNTYTFSKSLSEHVVNDLCKGKLNAAIVRPSIVTWTIEDPYSGWSDTFNGPLALMAGMAKGMAKVYYGNIDAQLDCVPVDIAVKFLILIAYQKTLSMNRNEISVYNASACDPTAPSFRDIFNYGEKLIWEVPYTRVLWFPMHSMTKNWYRFQISALLHQMIYSLFFDAILRLNGLKSMIFKIQKKLYVGNMVLTYFMWDTWTFVNDKCLALSNCISGPDAEKFSFIDRLRLNKEEEYYNSYKNMKICTLRTIFHEEYNKEKGYRNIYRFWVLDKLVRFIIFGLLGWVLFAKIQIFTIVHNHLNRYLQYLNEL